jgi:hypothetical protein
MQCGVQNWPVNLRQPEDSVILQINGKRKDGINVANQVSPIWSVRIFT